MHILTSGKMRDEVLALYARSIWLLTASNDIQTQYCHVQGVNNVYTDRLLRWLKGILKIFYMQKHGISLDKVVLFLIIIYIISENPLAAALWSSSTKHFVSTSFRDRTRVSYYAQFRLFIALSVYLSIDGFTSLSFVLMFVEYLHVQGLKYLTVLNYVSVLRHYFAYYSLPFQNVNHKKVKMLLKAIAINATYVP